MNDILGMVGMICIVGASYLFANKHAKENERLQNRVKKLENENHDFWTANLKKNKIIKHCEAMEAKQVKEFIEMQKEIDELKADEKELHETILFDNNLLIQKTEMLERGAKKYSEDQIVIADLNNKLCDANMEVVELKCTVEGMVKRGFVKLERARLLGRG